MASLHQSLNLFLLLLHSLLLASTSFAANDAEDKLFKGINRYRGALNLSALDENDEAACVADELADKQEHQPCTRGTGPHAPASSDPQVSRYPEALDKCKVEANSTRDSVVLRACVPNLVPDQVLANFTWTRYARYLNDSKYTTAGIGSEDDWIVVVLSTNSPSGSFQSKATIVGVMNSYLAALLAGLTLFLALL